MRKRFITILFTLLCFLVLQSELVAGVKVEKAGSKTSWRVANDAFYDEGTNTLYLVGKVTFRSLVRELDYSSDKGKVYDKRSPKIRPCLIEVLRTTVKYKEFDKVPCQSGEGMVCSNEKNALNVVVTSVENKPFLDKITKKISERRGIKVFRKDSLTVTQKTLDCSEFER